MRDLIIEDVHFDIPNVRQTALHVMQWKGCSSSLSQEEVEERMKESVLATVKSGEQEQDKMFEVNNMQVFYVIEDYTKAEIIPGKNHRYAVNFFVRVGHRQEK